MKICIVGWGAVARRLAAILSEPDRRGFEIAGILHRSGAVCGPTDINALNFGPPMPVADFLDACHADVLVELSTLAPESGEPAITHLRHAFARGMHVVTANKGPIANAWSDLDREARSARVRLLHESAVMDGTPVFNLFRHNLPGVKVLGFTGVLNSTTNLIVEAMENGASFEQGVAKAKALGVAEENHLHDTEGWDSAVKTAAIANVLMDARVTPAAIAREGISGFTATRVRELASQSKTVRLVSRAEMSGAGPRLSVGPEILDRAGMLASVHGASNLILFRTDRMGTIGAVSVSPAVEQTAYGVYIDLMELVRYPSL